MMEKMNFVMFCLGAFSLAVGLVAMPYVSMLRNAIKSRIKREKNTITLDRVAIEDLQSQIDNLAERLATRERNRKNNLRRDIREYLEELKNGK
jgi:TolA-binding protein